MKPELGKCDVCVIAHRDFTEKEVRYCSFCKAWLCDTCRVRYDQRALAAVLRAASRVYEKLVGEGV